MSPSSATIMLPPWTAVDPGVGVAAGAVVGVLPAGPDVAGGNVGELLLQAVAIRAPTARKDAKRFISIPFPCHQSGNRQQPRLEARWVPPSWLRRRRT